MDEAELRARLDRYPWYHRVRLTETLETPGVERYVRYQEPVLAALRSLPVAGGRVLDVGTRDGLFAFEAERLGAADVVAIDNNLSAGAVELLIPALGSRVRMLELNLLDARPDQLGTFDLVILAGVLYHLRYPIWSLRIVAQLLDYGSSLIVETAVVQGWPDLALLWCPTGTDGPYDATSPAFFNLKGLSDTLATLGLIVDRVELLQDDSPETSARRLLRRLGRGRPSIARATMVCHKVTDGLDHHLDEYWHGVHKTAHWT